MGKVSLGTGIFYDYGLGIYIHIHKQIKDMMTNYQQTQTQNSPDSCSVPSVLGILGFKWITLGRGKFHQDILQLWQKIKIWQDGPGCGC